MSNTTKRFRALFIVICFVFSVGDILAAASVTVESSSSQKRLHYDQAHGQGAPREPLLATAEKIGMEVVASQYSFCAECLKGVDILFLQMPAKPLSAEEKEAAVEFVKNGGSLLLVLDEEARQSLDGTGVNDIIIPFGMKLLGDLDYLHNCGAVAKAGEINRADRELPFSGGRGVEGGTPFAWQLDRDGNPAEPYAAYKKLSNGGRIVVMGEGMAVIFLGTIKGERLSGIPHDPRGTVFWGRDSGIFMEELLSWMMGAED